MTLKFVDGFDHYDTGHIAAKWPDVGAGIGGANGGITAGVSRHGGQAFFSLASGGVTNRYVSRAFPATTSWVIGFAFKPVGGVAASIVFCSLLDAGSPQVDLRLNTDFTVSITRSGAAITGGTSAVALTSGVWHYLEWKVTIADSIAANSCKLRLNGADIITLPAGSDTKFSGVNTASALRIGAQTGNTGNCTFYYDDLYVCDQAGAVNNDFLGDVYVETLNPNGAGSSAAWTPSSGANYQCVDDDLPNDDTDYVETTALTGRDLYAFEDLLSTPPSIFGVQVNALARKTDSGARTINVVGRIAPSSLVSGPFPLGDSYSYALAVEEVSPETGAAWTEARINSCQWGVELNS